MRFLILFLLIGGSLLTFSNLNDDAFGAVTGSANYCSQFPTFPECTGWRVEPISDNFWFCEYVNLPSMCNNPPNPEKEISPLTSNYCCGVIGDYHPKILDEKIISVDTQALDDSSPKELVIWTDKDHYSFGERVHVYGKFDFSDSILKNNNSFVDVSINDRKVILDLPVHSNGWFAGYFTLSNPYLFYTGNNLISITYFHAPNLDDPDKFTQASYIMTTGAISGKPFLINDTSIPGKISYEIVSESIDPVNLDLAIVRIVTPDGLVLPLPNIVKMNDLSNFLDIHLIPGTYEVIVTKGNIVTSQTFEYVK